MSFYSTSSEESIDDVLLDPDFDPTKPSTSKGCGQQRNRKKGVAKKKARKTTRKNEEAELSVSSSDGEPDQTAIADNRYR